MSHDLHRHTHAQAITDATFPFEVLRSDLPVLVDFYADWCGACQHLAPSSTNSPASRRGG